MSDPIKKWLLKKTIFGKEIFEYKCPSCKELLSSSTDDFDQVESCPQCDFQYRLPDIERLNRRRVKQGYPKAPSLSEQESVDGTSLEEWIDAEPESLEKPAVTKDNSKTGIKIKTYSVRRGPTLLGSFNANQLKSMAASGKLFPTDELRHDADKSVPWRTLSSVPTLSFHNTSSIENLSEGRSAGDPSPRSIELLEYGNEAIFAKLIDWSLDGLRSLLGEYGIASKLRQWVLGGHLALTICVILVGIISVWFAFMEERFSEALQDLLICTAASCFLIVGQWASARFCVAGERLIRSNPSKMVTFDLLDLLGLILFFAGVTCFGYCLYLGFTEEKSRIYFWNGMVAFNIGTALASVAFSPQQLNIQEDNEAAVGDEAIGILAFSAKALMFLGPFFYTVAMATSALFLFDFMERLWRTRYAEEPNDFATDLLAAEFIFTILIISFCSFLPLISYLYFLFSYLIIDLYRSIIALGRGESTARTAKREGDRY